MDNLWIDHVVDREKGIHMYHVAFSRSPRYAEFYEWHNSKKIWYEHTDMPHDYFVYLEESDRIELYYRFGDYITDTIEDSIDLSRFRNLKDPSPSDPLFEMLMECVRDEIDSEILQKIRKYDSSGL